MPSLLQSRRELHISQGNEVNYLHRIGSRRKGDVDFPTSVPSELWLSAVGGGTAVQHVLGLLL